MKHRHRFAVGALVVVALVTALALIAPSGRGALAAQGIIYVDSDAGGASDGSSWDDAYTSLQPALEAAVPGNRIWVAEGTYKPDQLFISGDPRSASFQLKNGVAIYGGFDPSVGATKWVDRDWVIHETILSGDLGEPDVDSDNSYHVFYHPAGTDLDESAILDGFAITGGTADYSTFPHTHGAGMYNHGSSPALSNCTFESNTAFETGGGMANRGGSAPTLTNCKFRQNIAGRGDYTGLGGGIHNDASSPVLVDCTFQGNLAHHGSGVFNDASSSPALTNCTFSVNTAWVSGAGMYNYASSPTLTNCIFRSNMAWKYGGGIFNTSSSSPVLAGCTFEHNLTTISGGGMFNGDSSPTLTNCIFFGNEAPYSGGMHNLGASPTLINCTFSGNKGGIDGIGGMHNAFYSSPTLTNCILWGNEGDDMYDYESTPVVSYSDIGGDSTYPGTGNIHADPRFVDAANGDYHLLADSPCIDTGSNAAPGLPQYDFEGDDRILDGDGDGTDVVDMGMDEFVRLVIVVEIDVTPDSPNNLIRLRSGAMVEVAILTTDDFEAGDVAHRTVVFGGAEVQSVDMRDVDGDEDLDMVLSFFPSDMVDLNEDSKEAILTGFTDDGNPIQSTDRVKVIP